MAPLTPLMEAFTGAEYQVLRDAQGVGFLPSPPPEHRPILTAWKEALLHALEEGERLPARELLRLERLACIFLASQGGLPPLTWATFYYQDRPEPERVLAPRENLLPHLRWRARNLPEPRRVHLAATDGRLILDLEAPLEAFLRTQGKGVELYAWPLERMAAYLEAANQGRAPAALTLEAGRLSLKASSWSEALARLEEALEGRSNPGRFPEKAPALTPRGV